MVEQEGLDQVGAVDLKWHFLEEVLHVKTILTNLVDDKLRLHCVKFKRIR